MPIPATPGRLRFEAVASDDAAADRFEDLRGFGWCEPLQVAFQSLDGHPAAEKLLHHAGEVTKDRSGAEVILPVLGDE